MDHVKRLGWGSVHDERLHLSSVDPDGSNPDVYVTFCSTRAVAKAVLEQLQQHAKLGAGARIVPAIMEVREIGRINGAD